MPTITVPSFPDRQAGAARRTLIWMRIRPAPASDGNRPGTLWRRRDFLLLWGGQAVSEAGSAVTVLAPPLTAVVVLRAPTFAVGLLTALATGAFLLIARPAGRVVDRLR
jgi:hypothetical protein